MLIGSGMGVGAALIGRGGGGSDPPPKPAPSAVRAFEASSAKAPAPEKTARGAPGTPVAIAPSTASVAAPGPTDAPVASPAEFETAAIACDAKDAVACRRAAQAVETGGVVPKDPERARTLRRVELTILVRKCEKGAVPECLTLAERYTRGEGGLEKNERTAKALLDHVRELCARHSVDACSSVR